MTYISQIDVEGTDSRIHKLRVTWIEEAQYSSTTLTRAHERSIWRPMRVTDVDTAEELFRFSADRFQSVGKRQAFTVLPLTTEPGGYP